MYCIRLLCSALLEFITARSRYTCNTLYFTTNKSWIFFYESNYQDTWLVLISAKDKIHSSSTHIYKYMYNIHNKRLIIIPIVYIYIYIYIYIDKSMLIKHWTLHVHVHVYRVTLIGPHGCPIPSSHIHMYVYVPYPSLSSLAYEVSTGSDFGASSVMLFGPT